LNERWPEYMFISEDNPHLTNRFCKADLGQTQIFVQLDMNFYNLQNFGGKYMVQKFE